MSTPSPLTGAGIQPRTPQTYTVTFDTDHADTPTPDVQTINEGSQVSKPATDPTRDGWLFDGWFNGAVAWYFEQPVTTDLTLTAHWTRGDSQWAITPNHGKTSGGDRVTLTPDGLRGIRLAQISTTMQHVMSIGSDGDLYTWGNNTNSVLGRITIGTSSEEPGRIDSPTDVEWKQVSAGGFHSMGLTTDGRLYTWGQQNLGALGRPSTGTSNLTPGEVEAPAGTTWTQIAAGWQYSMALASDGSLYTWGSDSGGQLGHAATIPSYTPVKVDPPAGTTWTKIYAGSEFSIAFASDGNLYTWGANDAGQLGRSTSWPSPSADRPGKVDPPAGITWTTRVSPGARHIFAFASDGNLYSWGANGDNQLGRSVSTAPAARPGKVAPPVAGTTWTQASGGFAYSAGIASDGNLYTWGNNDYLQLGRDTDATPSSRPGKVEPPVPGMTWSQVTSGYQHSTAIGSDGNVYTWGSNQASQLGRHLPVGHDDAKPGKVSFPGIRTVQSVTFDTSPGTSLEANPDGTAWKVTTPKHDRGPVEVTVKWSLNGWQPDEHLLFIYDGPTYTVSFDPDGGTPPPADQSVLEYDTASRPATDPTKAGWYFDGWFNGNVAWDFSTPITGNLNLKAHWSATETHWNIDPKAGPEEGGQTVTLSPPEPRGIKPSQISSGWEHSMTVTSSGSLYTWGNNAYGQVGDGTTTDRTSPYKVPIPAGAPADFTWKQASAGQYHSMAIGSDGNLYTWGSNRHGQVGDGTTTDRTSPYKVPIPAGAPADFTWKQASAGQYHSMAIGSDGNLYTWGDNSNGELGDTALTATTQTTPWKLYKPAGAPGGFAWKQASAGYGYSMAVGINGSLYTWGDNGSGQLGNKSTGPGQARPYKVPSPTGTRWSTASAGKSHSLAITNKRGLYSWGDNSSGQLGRLDSTKAYTEPGEVSAFTSGWTQASASPAGSSLAIASDGNLYSWGNNISGQLGRNPDSTITPQDKPGRVTRPAGSPLIFSWAKTSGGAEHSMAVGGDGNLYTWGVNNHGQLTHASTSTPGRADLFARGIPTNVKFDQSNGTNLVANPDGTWKVTTPAHDIGEVTVTIDWTLDGVGQTADATNRYRYQPLGVLPNAGGTGIGLLLLTGLLLMASAVVHRRLRPVIPVTNEISHE